jgi:hypothetical protein
MKSLDSAFFSYFKSEKNELFLWHDIGKDSSLVAEKNRN